MAAPPPTTIPKAPPTTVVAPKAPPVGVPPPTAGAPKAPPTAAGAPPPAGPPGATQPPGTAAPKGPPVVAGVPKGPPATGAPTPKAPPGTTPATKEPPPSTAKGPPGVAPAVAKGPAGGKGPAGKGPPSQAAPAAPAGATHVSNVCLPPRKTNAESHPRYLVEYPFQYDNTIELWLELCNVNYALYEELKELDPEAKKNFDAEVHNVILRQLNNAIVAQDLWVHVMPGVVAAMLLQFCKGQQPQLMDCDWSLKIFAAVRVPSAREEEVAQILRDVFLHERQPGQLFVGLFQQYMKVSPNIVVKADVRIGDNEYTGPRRQHGRQDSIHRNGRPDASQPRAVDRYGQPSPRRYDNRDEYGQPPPRSGARSQSYNDDEYHDSHRDPHQDPYRERQTQRRVAEERRSPQRSSSRYDDPPPPSHSRSAYQESRPNERGPESRREYEEPLHRNYSEEEDDRDDDYRRRSTADRTGGRPPYQSSSRHNEYNDPEYTGGSRSRGNRYDGTSNTRRNPSGGDGFLIRVHEVDLY